MTKLEEHVSALLQSRIPQYCADHAENGRTMPINTVADKLGVNRAALTSWIDGKTLPSLKSAAALADMLNISLDELAGRVGGR